MTGDKKDEIVAVDVVHVVKSKEIQLNTVAEFIRKSMELNTTPLPII